jgi:ketosteroid isomerase-like protein
MDPQTAAKAFLDRLFEAEFGFVKSDADGAAAFGGIFDAEAVIHQPAGLPYRGDWRGLDGVTAMFKAMRETWSDMQMADIEATLSGDVLFMSGRLTLTSRATGRTLVQPFAEVLRLRDGKLLDGTPFYYDTAEIQAAIG